MERIIACHQDIPCLVPHRIDDDANHLSTKAQRPHTLEGFNVATQILSMKITEVLTASGQNLAQASTTPLAMSALMLNKSSRVMPGFRGILVSTGVDRNSNEMDKKSTPTH